MSKSVIATIIPIVGKSKEIDFKDVYKYEVSHSQQGDTLVELVMMDSSRIKVSNSEAYIKIYFNKAHR